MTIGKAMKFIDQGQVDREFRNEMNRATTIPELYQVLSERDLSFSAFDFEEAYNNRLVNCQFAEQAEQLKEFREWWEMLHHFLGVVYSAESTAGACASASSCAPGACKSCGG
ncbi:MAG: hypothetical protein JXX14_20550 [Deltaproteobacteria bacterium]|nr:hypothetical protein [Deltaproteobacteria bacterium]